MRSPHAAGVVAVVAAVILCAPFGCGRDEPASRSMVLHVHTSSTNVDGRVTTEIDGDVRDETTGEPLANAKVELRSDDDPGPEPVVTAADGIYRFQDVTSRDYRIAATALRSSA